MREFSEFKGYGESIEARRIREAKEAEELIGGIKEHGHLSETKKALEDIERKLTQTREDITREYERQVARKREAPQERRELTRAEKRALGYIEECREVKEISYGKNNQGHPDYWDIARARLAREFAQKGCQTSALSAINMYLGAENAFTDPSLRVRLLSARGNEPPFEVTIEASLPHYPGARYEHTYQVRTVPDFALSCLDAVIGYSRAFPSHRLNPK